MTCYILWFLQTTKHGTFKNAILKMTISLKLLLTIGSLLSYNKLFVTKRWNVMTCPNLPR